MQLSIYIKQRHQAFVRHQERRAQRHRPIAGARHDAASHAAHFADPGRELSSVANRRRQQQHANSRRRQNDRLFPDMAAFFVGEIMRFVQHYQIGADVFAAAQPVE